MSGSARVAEARPADEWLGRADRITRHNARIGTRAQRLIQRVLLLFGAGAPIFLLVRALFRIRVLGVEHLDGVGDRVIFASRHFYELDPALSFYGAVWTRALGRPHFVAPSLASEWWFATPLRRAFSWMFGAIIVERGKGTEQSGMQRAAELLSGPRPAAIAIYPTGPVGRSRRITILPGIGALAVRCPDAEVVSVNVLGVQDLRWSAVLGLRRPEITVAFGTPFRARDVHDEDEDRRIALICERVESEWMKHEG